MLSSMTKSHRTFLRAGLPALLFTFLLTGFSTSAQAYITCNPVTTRQAFEGSHAVFLGKLVKITGFNTKQILGKEVLVPGGFLSQEHHFKFEVEKVWKGKVANPATFVAPGPLNQYPNSYHWRRQKQYVILVNKNELYGDWFGNMVTGTHCLYFRQVPAWHKKWDMIFLDFLTHKTGVEKALRAAKRLTVQPWENLGSPSPSSSNTFFQPEVLKSFFRIMLDGLKEWNQVEEYGLLAEVLELAVQRDEKVSSALYEMFQEESLAWKPSNKSKIGHRERSVFVMALALMESRDQHIQKQVATFLSQTIQYKFYWLYKEYWLTWRAELSLKKVGKWN